MRRFFAGLLVLTALLMPLRIGLAFDYADDEDLISVRLPDGDGIVAYADEQAYLPEEMHELAAGYELVARLLVRSYTPQDILGYTLDIVACPIRNLGTRKQASQEPSGSATTFMNVADAAYRDEAVALARSMYGDRFTMAAAQKSSFHGVPAMEIRGTGAAGSHWADYDCQVYLIANDQRLLIISAVYLRPEQEAAQSLLDSISLIGETSAPASQKTASATATPSETAAPAATAAADAAALSSAEQSTVPDWFAAVQTFASQHTTVVYGALAVLGALILAVALIVYYRSRRHSSWTMDDENAGHLAMRSARMSQNSHRRTGQKSNKEGKMEASERFVGSGRREYDYAEDISKYTQQPSADVNDVSRYTHGYEADDTLSEELKALQDEPIVMPKPIKIQSVGSRVERNRRKKRK